MIFPSSMCLNDPKNLNKTEILAKEECLDPNLPGEMLHFELFLFVRFKKVKKPN